MVVVLVASWRVSAEEREDPLRPSRPTALDPLSLGSWVYAPATAADPFDERARQPKLTAKTRRQRDVDDLRGALVRALAPAESKENGPRRKLEVELWSLSPLVKEAKHRFGESDEASASQTGRSGSSIRAG
jgi:hypothetical protein